MADKPIEKVNYDAPAYTTEQLMKMLIDAQSEARKSNEALIAAIIESRKPYVDPAVLKAKQDALEERKKAIAIELRRRTLTKQQCLHQRTNNDGTWDEKGRMNIKWLEHSNGIVKGVCGTCGSEFDATHNKEDRALLMKDGRALRLMGRARENVNAIRMGQ